VFTASLLVAGLGSAVRAGQLQQQHAEGSSACSLSQQLQQLLQLARRAQQQ
jgi:hypothetical protein